MYCCEAENSFAICLLSASANDWSGIVSLLSWRSFPAVYPPKRIRLPYTPVRPALLGPAKSGLRRRWIERARREPGRDAGVVVARRRDVVGGVGMEDRREVLDLPAPASLLALAAAVDRDPLALAVLVDRQQLPQ